MSIQALNRAVSLFPSQEAFAAALGVRSPSISEWRKRGRIPAERCRAIEELTQGRVTKAELRSDLFADAQAKVA